MAAPSKQDLIDALTKQNIPLTGEETVADLKRLIQDNAIELTDPKEIEEAQADPAAQEAIQNAKEKGKPGVIKEWTMNGHLMRRIRDEHGRITDVRV